MFRSTLALFTMCTLSLTQPSAPSNPYQADGDLKRAIDNRQYTEMRRMLAKNPALANARFPDSPGGNTTQSHPTPLIHAVGRCDVEATKLLLAHGAYADDIYLVAGTGRRYTALTWAIALLYSTKEIVRVKAIVKLLVAKGADVQGALHFTASSTNGAAVELAQVLLATKKVKVTDRDQAGNTPLHRAAAEGTPRMIRFLLAKGASRRAENREGYTPYDLAVENRNTVNANLLR